MQRLKILIWHVHGAYLNAITHIEHDWFLPVRPDRAHGYGGRGSTFDQPDWVREVPADRVRDLDLDLIVFQTPGEYLKDQYEILSEEQRRLPKIYLEHNVPRPHAVDQPHHIDDPTVLLVHVTQFNRLMWDNRRTPTAVVEHSVVIDPSAVYRGTLERGITVVNGMEKRPRIVGLDLFLHARERVPLDVAGMQTEGFGGLGDIAYRDLHRRMADYRFLFSPIRYTSLPLAVIEAMTIGMPVVALATTELPSVIQNGWNGYLSCEIDDLIERMRFLLANPEEALRLGRNAGDTARHRFSMDRFTRSWNAAFDQAIALRHERPVEVSLYG